jgi:hypothetical protein
MTSAGPCTSSFSKAPIKWVNSLWSCQPAIINCHLPALDLMVLYSLYGSFICECVEKVGLFWALDFDWLYPCLFMVCQPFLFFRWREFWDGSFKGEKSLSNWEGRASLPITSCLQMQSGLGFGSIGCLQVMLLTFGLFTLKKSIALFKVDED